MYCVYIRTDKDLNFDSILLFGFDNKSVLNFFYLDIYFVIARKLEANFFL